MYSTTTDKADIRTKATNDIHEGVRRVGEDVREAMGNVKDDLEDIARQTGRQAREFAETAEENVLGAAETLTAKIYDNPVQSSLISFGVGILLGLMMFRGR